MNTTKVNKMVLAALFLSIGLILPFSTGSTPAIGARLLHMHLPVLMCGVILSPKYGLLAGLILPITGYFMISMPPLIPAAYGGQILAVKKAGWKSGVVANV